MFHLWKWSFNWKCTFPFRKLLYFTLITQCYNLHWLFIPSVLRLRTKYSNFLFNWLKLSNFQLYIIFISPYNLSLCNFVSRNYTIMHHQHNFQAAGKYFWKHANIFFSVILVTLHSMKKISKNKLLSINQITKFL